MDLENAKVLITGGTLGIGKATALLLRDAGAQVAITGRNAARVNAVSSELGLRGICADVSKQEDVDRTYAEFLDTFGSLDVLVNNAGIGVNRQGQSVHRPLLELTEQDYWDCFSVNVVGAAMMAKRAAELFVKQNHGDIINIASTSALKGYARGSVYSASKFALKSMNQCWAAELRPHNVRVMLVNPSEVTTAFGTPAGVERSEDPKKLRSEEIAHAIKSCLEMDNRGFVPEMTVFATNPF